jgi:hypothetical protein
MNRSSFIEICFLAKSGKYSSPPQELNRSFT